MQFWTKKIKNPPDRAGYTILIKKRLKLGEFHRLVQELRNDPRRFHVYFRMTKEEFDYVHDLIKKDIQKQSTQFRKPISIEERLAVCLR